MLPLGPVRPHKMQPKHRHVRGTNSDRQKGVLGGGWVGRKMHCANELLDFNGPMGFFQKQGLKIHLMIYEYTCWYGCRISLKYKRVQGDYNTGRYRYSPLQQNTRWHWPDTESRLFIRKQTTLTNCRYWHLLSGMHEDQSKQLHKAHAFWRLLIGFSSLKNLHKVIL